MVVAYRLDQWSERRCIGLRREFEHPRVCTIHCLFSRLSRRIKLLSVEMDETQAVHAPNC